MASEQLTEYERRRLENIKRNDEMMASLKIHARLSQLVSSCKRQRDEKTTYKQQGSEKKPKPETPIVIRRSLRTRGMPPDSSGLPQEFNDLNSKPKSKPMKNKLTSTSPPSISKPVNNVLGPLPIKDCQSNTSTSTTSLVQKLTKLTIKLDDVGFGERPRSLRSSSGLGSGSPVKIKVEKRVTLDDPIDFKSLTLEPDNIARLMPGRIFAVKFFPSTLMTMVVAANKYGNLGFWDVKPDHNEEDNGHGIYLYQPHSAPVSAISVQPSSLSKVYTSSYDGLVRVMDIEREVFDLVYSSSSGSALFSLSQRVNDANSIYFGEGQGDLNIFDRRVGKISTSLSLHEDRINSIDFSSANTNIMATSSTDGLACLWDVRKMDVQDPKSKVLQIIKHGRAVHSAYFSPSGGCMATTSLNDNVGVLQGANFEDMLMIHHDNWTNRWVSSFRAVWGWDDTYLYIGNMKRRVDVLSVSQKKTVYAVDSSLMSAIPCRYDAHPFRVGMLAGATSGGQVYIWTSSSEPQDFNVL